MGNGRHGHLLARVLAATLLAAAALVACDQFSFYELMEDPPPSGALRISPISATVEVKAQCLFTATGGKPPYVFSVLSGSGSIAETTGLYRAPASPGQDVVRVTDKDGVFRDAYVTCVQ
jgi:hypothetical protein